MSNGPGGLGHGQGPRALFGQHQPGSIDGICEKRHSCNLKGHLCITRITLSDGSGGKLAALFAVGDKAVLPTPLSMCPATAFPFFGLI
jgi:hypothetical protein